MLGREYKAGLRIHELLWGWNLASLIRFARG